MGNIDKTFTNNYNEYKEFKDWADTQFLTFYNGHTVCIGNAVGDYEEADFDGRKLPIMNSPVWVDVYLIQHCKIDFVIKRLKFVYSPETYGQLETIDLTKYPTDLPAWMGLPKEIYKL